MLYQIMRMEDIFLLVIFNSYFNLSDLIKVGKKRPAGDDLNLETDSDVSMEVEPQSDQPHQELAVMHNSSLQPLAGSSSCDATISSACAEADIELDNSSTSYNVCTK